MPSSSRYSPRSGQIQSVLERLERGDVERGARQFVEASHSDLGAWGLLPEAIRATAVRNAALFLDEQADPHWADVDPLDLPGLQMPVLLTHGDQSPRWFQGIVVALAAAVPHAEVRTFVGAGHAPHLTHADAYVALVGDFLRRSDNPVTKPLTTGGGST
jgi:pimeloyl-ACP methyl ester carboxylesterase